MTAQWEKALISPGDQIFDAIRIIDEAAAQICLVVDAQKKLLGTITDGDIRRGILGRLELSAPVSEIMNKAPRVTGPATAAEEVLAVMTKLQIHQIPVVNDSGVVIGLETVDELVRSSRNHPNWVVLMAGGVGERLRPLTDNIPKPLIPVGQKPVLETILENFISQGFTHFFISVNYKSEMIKAHFGNGDRWGVEIRYLQEDKRLGTAGALSLIDETLTDPLLVMNGDLLTRVNFQAMLEYHLEQSSSATMAVREYDFQIPFGVVNIDGSSITSIDEKPTHRFFVNAGIYILEPKVLENLTSGMHKDMTDLFQILIDDQKQTSVFPVREYWLDIGQHEDLDRANLEFDENFH